MDRSGIRLAFLLILPLLGCAESSAPFTAVENPVQQQAARYAELPGLASSPHAGLKAELALLTEERMTPAALDAQLARASNAMRASPPYHALGEAIPAISRPM
ncbi:MAG TPA: hypothetical protein VFV87_14280, partial [Pirellulaceae bacterium]|nr:hypothetical protein [Pirellulaceae bacterium]